MNNENSANQVWLNGLSNLMRHGTAVSPRGQNTFELPQQTFCIDMRRPVITIKERSLNYRFMAAEAYWILSGDDRVSTIAPYMSKISQFSDDGKKFFGAYGPKVVAQLPYVINKLCEDEDTRQAGLTIWRESPPQTKDVPCTIAIFFSIRDGRLNCHVFMRSSDIWLGLPYDVFNFSMLAHQVCAFVNQRKRGNLLRDIPEHESWLNPGQLFLTAASSHLYERDVILARGCLATTRPMFDEPMTSEALFLGSPSNVDKVLVAIRDGKRGNRWWER